MAYQTYKIYNQEDFNRITKGIKVAQCMQLPPSYNDEEISYQLDDLAVSNALSCSFCDTVFDKIQQRPHYKLDWHRYNLKRDLKGLKPISEDSFNLLADEGKVSSLSGSEESENDEESGSSPNEQTKNESGNKNVSNITNRSKKTEKRAGKRAELFSDNSDTECNEEISKQKKLDRLSVTASRHTKVFFKNEHNEIFSIYRCLLHHKKDIPEVEDEMIAQALISGKNTMWTVVMVGGGHFAAAVFQEGEPILHKTFHSYTVRAKQGCAQSSRTTGNARSAGASLRRYNEASLTQHVQEILESWSAHIKNSSLILYRAVGPYNRTTLFGGKNPALNKNDIRLRKVPFHTGRATFREVQRVYDLLSTMEVYGRATDYTDCYPISPRQDIRKKALKVEVTNETLKKDASTECSLDITDNNASQEIGKSKASTQSPLEEQHRFRSRIDRTKSRKSPHRPLPDIVIRLAQSSSSSSSESEENEETNISLIVEDVEIDTKEHLLAFENDMPRYMKNKKCCRQKKKEKKDSPIINEILSDAKLKLWTACKSGDNDLLTLIMDNLLAEVKKCEQLQEENKADIIIEANTFVNMEDVTRLINDSNEDGNTMLHLAAVNGHLKLIWLLLEMGCNPCKKNKKLQTAYASADDKETRNIFRRFMAAHPDKFNYQKSQIPGPLTDEIEQKQQEKKKNQRKLKRMKEKTKRKEFEIKKQVEDQKQRFLNLSDREKRALAAERRILDHGGNIILRCFQCAVNMTGQIPFEYNANCFCSMPCLKEHRLRNKFVI